MGVHLEGELCPEPRLAIVGSRAARRRGLDLIPSLVAVAVEAGYSIVSGGAVGVDAAAHRAALALGVPQVAVLPLGADRRYPPHHAELFDAIVAAPGSGLLHARPAGTIPTKGMFASRNRIVVELSRAVIVVQAGLRSGTVGTGRLALTMGRPVGALCGSQGAAQLVAEGGRFIDDGRQVQEGDREAFEGRVRRWLAAVNSPVGTCESEGVEVPSHLVDIVRAAGRAGPSGLSADRCDAPLLAMGLLAEAEAYGYVTQVAPGRYVATVRVGP